VSIPRSVAAVGTSMESAIRIGGIDARVAHVGSHGFLYRPAV